jgi:hypothetical protein
VRNEAVLHIAARETHQEASTIWAKQNYAGRRTNLLSFLHFVRIGEYVLDIKMRSSILETSHIDVDIVQEPGGTNYSTKVLTEYQRPIRFTAFLARGTADPVLPENE